MSAGCILLVPWLLLFLQGFFVSQQKIQINHVQFLCLYGQLFLWPQTEPQRQQCFTLFLDQLLL
jgi:hypothetical protein